MLVHPHKIHFHYRRKNGAIHSLLSSPIPTDGDIEDQVKWLVKWPFFRAFSGILKGEYFFIIDNEINFFRIPFDGIEVK